MKLHMIVGTIVDWFTTGLSEDKYFNMSSFPHISVRLGHRIDDSEYCWPSIRPINRVGQAVLAYSYAKRWWPELISLRGEARRVAHHALRSMVWGREHQAGTVLAAVKLSREGWAAFPSVGGPTLELWETIFPDHCRLLQEYRGGISHPRRLDFCNGLTEATSKVLGYTHLPRPVTKNQLWEHVRAFKSRTACPENKVIPVASTSGPLTYTPFAGLKV